MNFLTSTRRASGLSEATTANTALIEMRKCEDPEGPNMVYDPPAILEDVKVAAIDDLRCDLPMNQDIVSKWVSAVTAARNAAE